MNFSFHSNPIKFETEEDSLTNAGQSKYQYDYVSLNNMSSSSLNSSTASSSSILNNSYINNEPSPSFPYVTSPYFANYLNHSTINSYNNIIQSPEYFYQQNCNNPLIEHDNGAHSSSAHSRHDNGAHSSSAHSRHDNGAHCSSAHSRHDNGAHCSSAHSRHDNGAHSSSAHSRHDNGAHCSSAHSRHDNGAHCSSAHSSDIDSSRDEKKPKKELQPKSKSPRKRTNRFDGLPEEEVMKKFLPDHLDHNLDILIIGINPGLFAAYKGHHYAGPGNHFWKCLYMSEITPEQYTASDDFRMIDYGIGFTNIVARTTRGSSDLTKKEIEEGGKLLLTKLQYYKPKIAVFNGKGIYEIFSKKKDVMFGKQPETVEGTNTHIWVMPSSSARCSQLPRAVDKLPFYVALKKFRDYINGKIPSISEDEIVFGTLSLKKKVMPEESPIKVER